MKTGKVAAICVSCKRGVQKKNVESAMLVKGWGIKGDAHAGNWHRQVSLLAVESIEKIRRKGLRVGPGSFAENFTTQGLNLMALAKGQRLRIGKAELEITQIGKQCHSRCAIYEQAGDCVMPREGIFARVNKGGVVKTGDRIDVLASVRGREKEKIGVDE